MMEKLFWRTVTLWWQWPRVLLWPFALHYIPLRIEKGLRYTNLFDNPFAILLFGALLMSYGGGAVIKLLIYKPRPIPRVFSNRLQKIDASSFPSIHTTNATIIALIWAWRWHQSILHGADALSIIPLISLVGIIAVSIALSRIALQKHYAIDVLAGSLFGMLIAGLLWLGYLYGLFYRR